MTAENKDPAGTQYDSGAGHGWTKILPQTQQRCCHHDVCYMINKGSPCINDNPCEIPCIFDSRKSINFSRCPSITLTPTLATHYEQRSQDTGKTVNALVLADLTALHRKRVAREEKRVFKEIEYERL